MWIENYRIGIDKLDNLRRSICDHIDSVTELIENKKVVSILYNEFDQLFTKLIVEFNFENTIFDIEETKNHLDDHNEILSEYIKLFVLKERSIENIKQVIENVKASLITHFEKHDSKFVVIENMKHYTDIGGLSYHGSMIMIVCEYGYFFKVFGEVDEILMNLAGTIMIEARSEEYFENNEWIVFIDIRNWDYLTQQSILLSRKIAEENSKRNKKRTIYVTGKTQINDYLVGKLSDNGKVADIAYDLSDAVLDSQASNHKLGKTISIKSFGNLNTIKY